MALMRNMAVSLIAGNAHQAFTVKNLDWTHQQENVMLGTIVQAEHCPRLPGTTW